MAEFDLSDVRQSWSFTLPIQVPSQNTVKRAQWKGNRGYYKRLREDFGFAIKAKAQWVPKATGPRKVTITRLIPKGGRRYDQDNLISASKCLVDEMVAFGLLKDDSEAWAVIQYEQEKSSEHGTRVTLEEV